MTSPTPEPSQSTEAARGVGVIAFGANVDGQRTFTYQGPWCKSCPVTAVVPVDIIVAIRAAERLLAIAKSRLARASKAQAMLPLGVPVEVTEAEAQLDALRALWLVT